MRKLVWISVGLLVALAFIGFGGAANTLNRLDPTQPIVDPSLRTLTAASLDGVDVIISFADRQQEDSPRLLTDALGDLGDTQNFELTQVVTATVNSRQLDELENIAQEFGIVSVTRNRPLVASEELLWIDDRSMVGASASTADGAGTTIAILDTGGDANHEALDAGKIVGFHDVGDGNWPSCPSHSTDTSYDDSTSGHGTHVASIAAGDASDSTSFQGIAPAASIVVVKVLDCDGSGSEASLNEGIAWVKANRDDYGGIDVVNVSIEGASCWAGSFGTGNKLNELASLGIVPVVAAGNKGPSECSVTFPGDAIDAITVGSADSTGVIAQTSGRGPTATGAIKPDIVGPGVDISAAQVGTFDGYVTKSGTSMATPFIAGVAALLRAEVPSATVDEVRVALTSTALDRGPVGLDTTYGYGLVAVADALVAIVTPLPTPTPSPTPPTPTATPDPSPTTSPHVPSGTSNSLSIAALDPLEPGPSQIRIRGWSYDPDLPTFSQIVHVYAFYDGSAIPVALDTPVVSAAKPRPDVNAAFRIDGNHGFNRSLAIRPGTHKVCVYSLSVTGTGALDGLNRLIDCRNVTIEDESPARGVLDSVTRTGDTVTVTGWAYDLDLPERGLAISIVTDNTTEVETHADQPRSDINAILSVPGDHGFSISYSVAPGPHQVCATAIGIHPDGSLDLNGIDALGCRDV